jgi:hypothetical protein
VIVPRLLPFVVMTFLLSGAAGAHAACTPTGVVPSDPASFTVKRCWTETDLGVPAPLGGLHFSADGSTLYVIGGADSSASAIHALPVTRDAATHEVVDLAASAGSFPGMSPAPGSGLDAGLEVGPGGTYFMTYLGVDVNQEDVTVLGERPAGVSGAETQFDTGMLSGITNSLAGLTFSPFITDPGTSFGIMQVSTLLGAIYDVPLTATGTPGTYEPASRQLFVTLQTGSVGAIQYVPGGAFAGHLTYTSFDDGLGNGTVHRVPIDPTTGFAIDQSTGVPMLATTDPQDVILATGFVPGPIGVEFDAGTNDDLFVTTYNDQSGTAVGKIYQIGGFSGRPPTTTTTTLPPPSCEDAAPFESIECRLDLLGTAVDGATDLGALKAKLKAKVSRARALTAQAAAQSGAGRQRPAKRALGAAVRAMAGFRARLASRAARHVGATTRASLTTAGNAISDSLRALRGSL